MLPKETSFASLLVALTILGIAVSGGYEGYRTMSDKAQAQTQAVADFQQWKREYTQLLPVEQAWNAKFKSAEVIKDLYSLYSLLGASPATNPDTLVVDKIERLTQDSIDLHAQRVCLASSTASGVDFEEKSFDTLAKGLEALAARPDVQMGSVTFFYDKDKAHAVVKKLCILIRDAEGGKK